MKLKLDENFGSRTQKLIRDAGHDVETVLEENLQGATDKILYEICCTEQRCLLTLDLDFSDVMRFPPVQGGGLVVLRVPRNPSLSLLERLVQQFLDFAKTRPPSVELDRIRIHQSESDE